jgi:hypothetical protein
VTKRLQTIKKNMLADREVRAAYDALADEFDLARELIAARVRAGLTQAEWRRAWEPRNQWLRDSKAALKCPA